MLSGVLQTESFSFGHTRAEPVVECLSRRFGTQKPFGEREGSVADRDATSSTSVSILHGPSCPPAVFGAVGTIIVDPIDRMVRVRSSTHIGEEVSVVSPSIANHDASASVVLERFRSRAVAARKHARPSAVFWRCRSSVRGLSVNRLFPVCLHVVASKAPAACCSADSERFTNRDVFVSAIAAAPPLQHFPSSNYFDYEESPEPFAGEIDES